MTSYKYKEALQTLRSLHESEGVGAALLDPDAPVEGLTIVNVTPDDDLCGMGGKRIASKVVRRWLYEQRKRIQEVPGTPLLWSAYDEENDRSFVGIGTMTDEETAAALSPTSEVTDG